MKIALIQAPIWGVDDPSLGLALLSACLKKAGHDARVFDLNIELYHHRLEKYSHAWAIEQSMMWSRDEFVERFFDDAGKQIDGSLEKILKTYDPDVIGFSVTSASKAASSKLARLFKSAGKRIPIVFGGHLMMAAREGEIEPILTSGTADFVVRGEGETTFVELVQVLANGGDPACCPGLQYRDAANRIITTSRRSPMKDLDELPFMDFSDTPLSAYESPPWLGNHLTFQASRGCVWKCRFCSSTNYWSGFRCMSGRRIYEEIKYHVERNPGILHVEFMDLLFNADIGKLDEFCELMIEKPFKKALTWHANAIIRSEMTAERARKLKAAGCIRLTYGIESGSQKVLDAMGKRFKIGDASDVLRNTHDAGMQVKTNFMFGYPGETEDDFQATLDFLALNARYITTAYPSFSFCVIDQNSYLESHMDEFGIIPNPDDNLYWESSDGKNTYPERMRRWEMFIKHARSLGVDVGIGLDTSTELHKCMNLAFYYKSRKDLGRAREYFGKYLEIDPHNKAIIDEMNRLREKNPGT